MKADKITHRYFWVVQ